MECVEYCMTCNPDGLDVTEEAALEHAVVEAAVAAVTSWEAMANGPEQGLPEEIADDIECELRNRSVADRVALFATVSALKAHREAK
jgi:hypothetical protein